MTRLDYMLKRWRIDMIRPHLPANCRVLDIGCGDGALFDRATEISDGVGVDPTVTRSQPRPNIKLCPGRFPSDVADLGEVDAVTMLAVLEHVPREDHARLARECFACLKPNGMLLITVPSRLVDTILHVLIAVRLVEGETSMDQHYGFDPRETIGVFVPAGFELVTRRRFQLGMNNLFVFRRPA